MDESDQLPLPPPTLRERVGGVPDADEFLTIGRVIYRNVNELLEKSGRSIEACHSILDFGCGCGRLLRHFRPNGCYIAGNDIDKEAVDWCAENLTNASRLVVNNPWPPLPFDESTFDLICAISVFTHLPQDMEQAWLSELRRLLRPDGLLVASLLGESALAKEVKDALLKERFYRDGFCHCQVFPPGGVLPDFYQITYHAREYVEAGWSQFFEIAGYYARGVNTHQDAVVCRKR